MKAHIIAALAAGALVAGSLAHAQGTGDMAAYTSLAAGSGTSGGEIAVTTPAAASHYGTYLTLDAVVQALAEDLEEKLDALLASDKEFEAPYHPYRLKTVYAAVPSVTTAAANLIVGDGSDIIAHAVGTYTFKAGWGDCISGCLNYEFWTFTVLGPQVDLVAHYVSPVPTEPTTWGGVKGMFRGE